MKGNLHLNITTKTNKIETKITFFYKKRKFPLIRIFEKKIKNILQSNVAEIIYFFMYFHFYGGSCVQDILE